MKLTVRSSIWLGMFTVLLITACAMTQLTSAWKDPSYRGPPRKIMVVAVAKKPINKRIFEDEFVRQLKSRGTDAVASYTVMPGKKQGDHAVIAAKMKELGADAILISRLVSKKVEHTYIPGSAYYLETNNWRNNYGPGGTAYYPPSNYGAWHDYYGYGTQILYTPGYMAEDEYALMEINLYDAGSDKLIWSAESETLLLGSDQNQIKSYINVMVNAMAGYNLLDQR